MRILVPTILVLWLAGAACHRAARDDRQFEHGTFQRQPDGGYRITECSRQLEHGQAVGPVSCENVERERFR